MRFRWRRGILPSIADTKEPTSLLSAVIGEQPIRGVPNAKFLRLVQEQLAPLKDVPAHGNRELHRHPLVITLVFSFYDPLIRSLRAIEGQSVVEPITGAAVWRMAKSTPSDALRAFDPRLLKPLIENLQRQIPDLRGGAAGASPAGGGPPCFQAR